MTSKLAEWARDHYLGPGVTFGEWLSYEPPKVGGKPSFSLAVPSGQAISSSAASVRSARSAKARTSAFRPDIPASLASLAGTPPSGEGQRRGNADPGGTGWGPKSEPWIPPGLRAGLLATFNGGFKLDSAEGGFYLNGRTVGTLTPGTSSTPSATAGTRSSGTARSRRGRCPAPTRSRWRCSPPAARSRSGRASASRCWWRPRHLVSTLPLALALCRFGALTGRRTVRPVEEMITGDGPMIACEVAWLGLSCAGLAAAG